MVDAAHGMTTSRKRQQKKVSKWQAKTISMQVSLWRRIVNSRAYCRDRSQLPIHGSRASNSSSSSSGSSDGPLDVEAAQTLAAKFDFVISEWNAERRRRRCGGSNIFPARRRRTFIVYHTMIIKQTTAAQEYITLHGPHDRCPRVACVYIANSEKA